MCGDFEHARSCGWYTYTSPYPLETHRALSLRPPPSHEPRCLCTCCVPDRLSGCRTPCTPIAAGRISPVAINFGRRTFVFIGTVQWFVGGWGWGGQSEGAAAEGESNDATAARARQMTRPTIYIYIYTYIYILIKKQKR